MPSQNPSPTYIHSLTTAFTSTLDEIPQDMCRHFADLRELDAVLSHNLNVITKRIEELTDKIEGGLTSLESLDPPVPPPSQDESPDIQREFTPKEERASVLFQWLLAIADDTTRIKLGGEDKIRVASLAADHMNAYYNHLLALVRRMHDLDDAYALDVIAPHTVYPHVSPSSLVDPLPDNRRHLRRPGAAQKVYNAPYPQGSQDTPKRRRLNGQPGINQLHGRGDVDTDDYSTPRRGVQALDEEAYRPGGNTASKAKSSKQKKEIRHGGQHQPAVATDMNMTGRSGLSHNPGATAADPVGGMYGQPAAPSHKSHKQSSHGKPGGNALPPGVNPQPPLIYSGYGGKNARIFVNPYESMVAAPFDMQMAGYAQTANMNPVMEAYHHSAMNMNPNLNQLPPGAAYPHSMGMPLPSTLPPPPSAGGRPSSSSLSSKNVYDVPAPGSSSGTSRQNHPSAAVETVSGGPLYAQGGLKGTSRVNEGTGGTKERDAGNPGGLVPVPMMTHLPPMNSITQSTALNVASHPQPGAPADATQSRSRSYSTQSYGGYGVSEQTYSASSHPVYQQSSSSTYPSSSAGGPLVEKPRSDVHPSLASSKELPPLNTHVRDLGLGSAGISGSSGMHTSLPRDPPFRTNSAGSGDRSEREMKVSSAPSRSRSGTVDGNGMPSSSTKYRETGGEQDYNQMPGSSSYPAEPRSLGPVGFASHPSLRSGPSSAGASSTRPSHGHSQSQASRYGYGDPTTKMDDREVTTPVSAGGSKRGSHFDHAKNDREGNSVERYDYGRASSSRGIRTDDVTMSEPGDDKALRTPVRRKTGDETLYRMMESGGSGTVESQNLDEDSKTYCICKQQSFGEMIGCDDSECEIEWFHLQCLGITSPPPKQERFVCPQCKARRAKGNRKPGKKKGNGGTKGRGL